MEGDESSEEDDKDYLAGDNESSEDDEEAMQIRADLKELKKKLEASCLVVVDEERHEVNVENFMATNSFASNLNDDASCIDVDTDEDDDSYDETSDGELVRKKREFPKYDGNAAVPTFSVGMPFSDKSTFREAVIKYGLVARKVIKFVKNEATKCRAVCTWPNYPWVLHLSKTSRSQVGQLQHA